MSGEYGPKNMLFFYFCLKSKLFIFAIFLKNIANLLTKIAVLLGTNFQNLFTKATDTVHKN